MKWILPLALVAWVLQGCYSVRISGGCAADEQSNERQDFYRDLNVQRQDTVIKMSMLANQIDLQNLCREGGLATVEYRNTFGNLLRLFFTFGKHRKVKICYVCCKELNH